MTTLEYALRQDRTGFSDLKHRFKLMLRKSAPLSVVYLTKLYFAKRSILKEYGWSESVRRAACVDAKGDPIPWYTYSAIRFLESRVKEDMDVFEYGSGFSTLWWHRRIHHVITCEHDPQWHEAIIREQLSNVTATLKKLGDEYETEIGRYTEKFDIVVVDGRNRSRCAANSLVALKPGGVLIWDNSDRAKYHAGLEHIRSQGFRRLDFHGLTPLEAAPSCTTVFYRDTNCFDI